MIKNLSKNSEFNHFTALANDWWAQNSKFKILHQIIPIRIEYILSIINRKKLNNIKILDLGCGGGLTCEPLSRLGADVTGVDFVKKNIEIAKNHAKKSNLKIEYLHQDLELLDINKKFKVVLVLEVLEHIEKWTRILPRIKSILKPNGYLIISTINRTLLSKFFAIYIAENILQWIPKKTHAYDKLITPDELSESLKKNNFSVIDISGMIYNPISKDWKLNKKLKMINYFCSAQLN